MRAVERFSRHMIVITSDSSGLKTVSGPFLCGLYSVQLNKPITKNKPELTCLDKNVSPHDNTVNLLTRAVSSQFFLKFTVPPAIFLGSNSN